MILCKWKQSKQTLLIEPVCILHRSRLNIEHQKSGLEHVVIVKTLDYTDQNGRRIYHKFDHESWQSKYRGTATIRTKTITKNLATGLVRCLKMNEALIPEQWDVEFFLFEGYSSQVAMMVPILKWKIRKQDNRVYDKSNYIVNPFVVTECILWPMTQNRSGMHPWSNDT